MKTHPPRETPETKPCSHCKVVKAKECFRVDLKNRSGLSSRCIDCLCQANCRFYEKNAEAMRERAVQYGKQPEVKARQRERYRADEEYRNHRREMVTRSRRKESAKQKRREWQRKQRKTQPTYKLRINLARRVRDALVLNRKSLPTMHLIGCSIDQLKGHLESLWQPGMSWENYTVHGWHVDHIIPCAAFDLANPEEQRKCFHYTNLQPLWAIDNWRKNDYVPDYQI